jgi:chromosome partitioning protein
MSEVAQLLQEESAPSQNQMPREVTAIFDEPDTFKVYSAIQQKTKKVNDFVSDSINEPLKTKVLRTWLIGEVALILGLQSRNIKDYETDSGYLKDGSPAPLGKATKRLNGYREYSIEKINKIRIFFSKKGMGNYIPRPEGTEASVIAVTFQKGGVGKTTTTLNLGSYFALYCGYRVLIIDLDGQGNATSGSGFRPNNDFFSDDEYTITPALIDDPSDIKEVISKTCWSNIDLIRGNAGIEALEMSLNEGDPSVTKRLGDKRFRLNEALKLIRNDYDIILIDCAPNVSTVTTNALYAADIQLHPVQSCAYSQSSLTAYSSILQAIMKFSPRPSYVRGLLSGVKKNEEHRKFIEILKASFSINGQSFLLDNQMIDCVAMERANNEYGSLYEKKPNKEHAQSHKKGLKAFNLVSKEITALVHKIWGLK